VHSCVRYWRAIRIVARYEVVNMVQQDIMTTTHIANACLISACLCVVRALSTVFNADTQLQALTQFLQHTSRRSNGTLCEVETVHNKLHTPLL